MEREGYRPPSLPALRGRPPRALAARRDLAHLLRNPGRDYRSLAQVLLSRGLVTAAQLSAARKSKRTLNRPLGDILLAQGAVSEVDLITAQSTLHGLGISDLGQPRPDHGLAACLPVKTAIAYGAVPWRWAGSTLVVALAEPDHIPELRRALPPDLRVSFTLAARDQILAAQTALYGEALARRAEGRTPEHVSCRTWRADSALYRLQLVGVVLAIGAVTHPTAAAVALFALALLVFYANIALKVLAFATTLRVHRAASKAKKPIAPTPPIRQPLVTIFVPLFKEREIASSLIANLSKLDYPPDRLDVILVTEADDDTTHDALARCTLPPWMRAIAVPPGQPRTKPRALNFALNFARGEIIGIYDAEDRPEPDQITRVVKRFAQVPPEVACLQGRLDYYNSHHNALARCFSIEYACWFRVLLPGVQRLGLFVPLGGTTLFLRRNVLEKLGAWDAHNVTEDAELGLRLTRHGYRTEIVETTTFEEANAAVVPWIKQRTRWQKGYLITWAIAMRDPLALWRDLGTWRFFGFQVQVLFAVVGFLIAPLLWSFIVKSFGMAHPIDAVLTPAQFIPLAISLLFGLLVSLAVSIYATRAQHLRPLRRWIPLVEFYHFLGTLAACRAATEMLIRPFFWAKTTHGQFGGAAPSPVQAKIKAAG